MTSVERTIDVQLFAGARAAVGADRITVALGPNATGRDLRRALATRFPGLAPLIAASRFAVESAFLDDDQRLSDQREVAWIPPVSGG